MSGLICLKGWEVLKRNEVLGQVRQGAFLAKLCTYRVATTQVVTFSQFAQRCCGGCGGLGRAKMGVTGGNGEFLEDSRCGFWTQHLWQPRVGLCGRGPGLAYNAAPWLSLGELPGQERTLWDARPVMSKLDLVLANPVPCPQGPPPHQLGWRRGRGDWVHF